MAGLALPSKPKTPFGALLGNTSYGGAVVPSPVSAAPATPTGTSPQSTTDWYARNPPAPSPAVTVPYGGGLVSGPVGVAYDPAAEAAKVEAARVAADLASKQTLLGQQQTFTRTTAEQTAADAQRAYDIQQRDAREVASLAAQREHTATQTAETQRAEDIRNQTEATRLANERNAAAQAAEERAAAEAARLTAERATATRLGEQEFNTGMYDKQLEEAKALLAQAGGLAGSTSTPAPVVSPTPTGVATPTVPARVGYGGATVTGQGAPGAAPTGAVGGTVAGTAESGAWGRAKDIIGRSTSGALKSLKEAQAARGFGQESGVYGAQEGELMSQGLRSLGDVARTQAENELAAQREREALVYQGDITQRAQDLGLSAAGMTGGITQRGQDIDALATARGQDITAAGQKLSLLPSLLALMKYAAY